MYIICIIYISQIYLQTYKHSVGATFHADAPSTCTPSLYMRVRNQWKAATAPIAEEHQFQEVQHCKGIVHHRKEPGYIWHLVSPWVEPAQEDHKNYQRCKWNKYNRRWDTQHPKMHLVITPLAPSQAKHALTRNNTERQWQLPSPVAAVCQGTGPESACLNSCPLKRPSNSNSTAIKMEFASCAHELMHPRNEC